MIKHIVFYGTLMQKAGGRGLTDSLVKTGVLGQPKDITILGRLYNVGSFPALTMGDLPVRAEVFEIQDQKIMTQFDGIEGYSGRKDSDLYTRTVIWVPEIGAEAWVYTWNRDTSDLKLIESGSWV